jgi:small-conductance mechanosensitive channel
MVSVSKTAPPAEPALLNADMWAQLNARIAGYYDLTANWLRTNAIELIIASLIGFAIYLALSWIKRKAATIAQRRGEDGTIITIAWRAISRTKRFFRIMLAVELVNEFANAPAPLAKAILFLFTISTVVQVAIWLREIILSLVERRAQQDGSEQETLQSAMTLIRLAVSFAVFAIATIVILDNLGVNVTGLIAGLGVGGIAIGLAAQGIFSDLFAAISIIFDRPFKRGDTVTYDTTTGRVERIGMKSTRIRALTGEEKIISNSKLLEKEITNVTATDHRRTQFLLSLVYHTPSKTIAALPDLLKAIVEKEGLVFIRAGFANFGPSSLDFQLTFDVSGDDLDQLFDARHRVGVAIIESFVREGIRFAYPTQTTYTAAPDGTMVMPFAGTPATAEKPLRKR